MITVCAGNEVSCPVSCCCGIEGLIGSLSLKWHSRDENVHGYGRCPNRLHTKIDNELHVIVVLPLYSTNEIGEVSHSSEEDDCSLAPTLCHLCSLSTIPTSVEASV